ncbi:MAG: type II secretion system F family protein [Paenibacillaceae bacterium]|nr:type II secretion system F family protein [Paenibacillaceae bacterium]
MPSYQFVAVSESGKRVRGVQQSTNKQAAILDLRGRGYAVRSIEEKAASIWNADLAIGRVVKLQDFVVFCRQFATLVRAGIQIDRALAVLVEQTKSKPLRKALADACDQVRSGFPLSKAMGDHPRIFPEMFVNMIASGETGGHLDDVLERMADTYEKENNTVQKVKSALTYPIILIFISIAVVIFLLIKIVPTFVSLFEEQGERLPLITRFIMGASDVVIASWWALLLLVVIAVVAIKLALSNEKGKYAFDLLKFKLPLFGDVFRKAAIARMARTMASLYVSGVAVLQSLDITGRVVGNRVLARVLEQSRHSLQQGKLLSEPLAASKQFPAMAIQMIIVGEETGQLDAMLTKVAEFYEEDVGHSVDRLKAVVEPLMLLLVSGIVGVIVAAVMTPIFTMYQSFLK